jgi:(1->4)-alpha-D-glucan 1-alpha-D-glucosylmutase
MEVTFLETVVGAWPVETERVEAALGKAAKEAKTATSWRRPDPAYEEALMQRVRDRLADRAWTDEVAAFLAAHAVVERGRVGALAQVTLELTSPGVPDTYQGDEVWNLSLVDPDNRRTVDFDRLEKLLDRIASSDPEEVLAGADEGLPKLWLVHRLLQHRRRSPWLYESTRYAPLEVEGDRADAVVAFARDGLAVVVPARTDLESIRLAGPRVALPEGQWRDILSGGIYRGPGLAVGEAWSRFPVAVLERVGK